MIFYYIHEYDTISPGIIIKDELEDLNNQLFETYKSIEEEFQYQQEFYKKLKEA